LARFAADHVEALRHLEPAIPDGLDDRASDNWEPLLAVAELAGGWWPARAKRAAMGMSGGREEGEARILILSDLRDLFKEMGDKIASADIVDRLGKMEERPWPEWGRQKKPITQTQLAPLLKPFDIRPKTVRLKDQTTAKGYDEADCADAFKRYLGPSPEGGGF
jgi:putative DNA primase/helicase